jgi:L-ascorbate metabolism protein UlaG (beta-lactamase superfamily)
MRMTFYAHASFRLETPEVSVVTDPYTPGASGFDPLDEPADLVIMRPYSHAAVRRKHPPMASKLPLSACGFPQQSSTFSIIF